MLNTKIYTCSKIAPFCNTESLFNWLTSLIRFGW